MGKAEIEYEYTRFCVVFFPIASYQRVGDASLLSVFGITVYQRVGDVSLIFGVDWANTIERRFE